MLSSRKTISVLIALVLVLSFSFIALSNEDHKIVVEKPSHTAFGEAAAEVDQAAAENARLEDEAAAEEALLLSKAQAPVAPIADRFPIDLKANPYQTAASGSTKDPNVDLFFEGFEAGVPPTGWTAIVNNPAGQTWAQGDYAPFEGTYYATCEYDATYSGDQDEWIITPSYDLSGGTAWYLNFAWNGSYYWSVDPYDNCDLTIKISTDGGTTWTDLWNEDSFGVFDNWVWYEVSIDLSAYLTETDVQFAIHYYGYDGAQLSVDAFTVNDLAPPVGRCCYDYPGTPSCIDNVTEDECLTTYGGIWTQGLDCTTDCPLVPDNDDWTNAEAITSFPATINGSTVAATVDCPGVLDWNAVWYVFEAPYAENDIVLDYCGTDPALETVGIVVYANDVNDCSAYIIADDYAWDVCPVGEDNPHMNWDRLPGPATYYLPVYTGDTKDVEQDFTINIDLTESEPLPPGADCSDPNPHSFGSGDLPYTIAGASTCGMVDVYSETCLGYYDGGEDMIFEVTLTEAMDLKVTLDPKGTSYTGFLLADDCPSTGDFNCLGSSTSYSGDPHGILSISLTAGTYYVMVDTWPSPDCIPDFDLTFEAPPVGGEGDNCDDPLKVEIPGELPFFDDDQFTCGRNNFYAAADMCYGYGYGGGEDIVYEVTVTAPTTIEMTMDPQGSGWTYVEIRTECVPPAGDCVYYFRNTSSTVYESDPVFLDVGTYYIIIDTWPSPACIPAFDFTIAEGVPCEVLCPSGAVDEDEACGDDTNGGCNATTPAFKELNVGETVCGTVWFDGSTRDTDWFLLDLDDWYEITLTAETEFDALWGFLEYATNPGSGDCADLSGYLAPYLVTEPCEDPVQSITTTLPPGQWMVFMAPDFTDNITCTQPLGGHYYMEVAGVVTDPAYCDVSTSYYDEYIAQVIFADQIDNSSGNDLYADYTDTHIATLAPGETYDIEVVVGGAYSSDEAALWVDWNQDYVFDVATEEVYLGTGYGPYVTTVTVPNDAVLGETTMRIRLVWNTTPLPCGSSSYGEVEDYGIIVEEPVVTTLIDPNPLLAVMAYLVEPMDAIVYMGGPFAGETYGLGDVDWSTVTVNGLPTTTGEVVAHPEFDENGAMEILVPVDDLVLTYGLLWDAMETTYTIEGAMLDATPFTCEGVVTYFGHSAGDLNADANVNIADLTMFIGWMFNGGSAPHVTQVADVNGSGDVNITDVTYMVSYMFKNGPALQHP